MKLDFNVAIDDLRDVPALARDAETLGFDGLWTAGSQHYAVTLMTPFFAPRPIEHPRIPIYIAPVNPYNLRLAGELCDGVHLHPFRSVKYLREFALPHVEAGLAKRGRSRADLVLATSVFMVTGP